MTGRIGPMDGTGAQAPVLSQGGRGGLPNGAMTPIMVG
jgi:hypothetical protein